MTSLQSKLDYAESVANYFIKLGEGCGIGGKLEESLKYTSIAASILCRQNRTLACEPLEANLRRVASQLPTPAQDTANHTFSRDKKPKCLHVLTEAHSAGGSTGMAIRWIRKDANKRHHSIVILSQETPLPKDIRDTVNISGGAVYVAEPQWSLVEKASWLRQLARAGASHVILHVAPNDVICGAAFGDEGGPPVLLVNHAAHAYWTGASIADLVVNCRGSFLERSWTIKHRGISRYVTVPIPLDEGLLPESPIRQTGVRTEAREVLGLPHDSTVILTVGARFKYMPTDDLDFISVFEEILQAIPDAYLICVGFTLDERWRAASHRLSDRVRCLGVLSASALSIVHDAADLYVEGFPFGTTTALLEAVIHKLPAVLAPGLCPPPYASDGVALDATLTRWSTLEEYISHVLHLANDRQARNRLASDTFAAVRNHHAGEIWMRYMEAAMAAAPAQHRAYVTGPTTWTPNSLHEYWARFFEKWGGVQLDDTLDHSLHVAIDLGLKPRMSHKQRADIEQHRTSSDMVSTKSMAAFLNCLLPALPPSTAAFTFRAFTFLFGRPRLLSRAGQKAVKAFTKNKAPEVWYSEYQNASAASCVNSNTSSL
jgi:glycosyltransferase involved in cell wall biosynthesis